MKLSIIGLAMLAMAGIGAQGASLYGVQSDSLYLHWSADNIALPNGAAVTSWRDSANGNMLRPNGTTAPQYVTNYANGHSAVLFDGIADALQANLRPPAGVLDTASITYFVVGQFLWTWGTKYMMSAQNYDADPSGNNRLRLAAWDGNWRHRVGAGTNHAASGADTDLHVFSMVSGQRANETSMLVDGTVVRNGNHGNTANCLPLSRVNLGAYYGSTVPGSSKGPAGFAHAYVAEVLIYDGAMTNAEIDAVNAALTAKYIPEPSAALLAAMSLLAFIRRRRT